MIPGDSPSFCVLPWGQLNISVDGQASPCCVWRGSIGTLRRATLEELWDSPGMRRLRLDLLQGRQNPSCASCREDERIGIRSLRQECNERFRGFSPPPDASADGGRPGRARLRSLDLRFSNECNFRCRTCGPLSSSAWYEEARHLRRTYWGPRVVKSTRDPQELWARLEPLLPDLQEISFAGGEPLLAEGHARVLDELLQRGLTRIRLSYTTNFSMTRHRDSDVLRLWDRFDDVRINASLDGSGRRGEYLRKGQVWERVLAERRRMAEACPRARFAVTATVSAMNVLHIPDFHQECLQQGIIANAGDFQLVPLKAPRVYRVQVLPASWKEQVARRYQRHIDSVLRPLGQDGESTRRCFQDIVDFMTSDELSWLMEGFQDRTRRLDELRGEDFTQAFPELAGLMTYPCRGHAVRRWLYRQADAMRRTLLGLLFRITAPQTEGGG